MKPARFLVTLTVAVGLGALVVGHAVAIPSLHAQTNLVDANMAKAMAGPLLVRLWEVMLVVFVIACLAGRRASGFRAVTTLALVGVILGLVDRFWLLPQLTEAWSRVDLVARLPADRFAEVQQFESWHRWSVVATGVLLTALLALLTWVPRRPARAASPAPVRSGAGSTPAGEQIASGIATGPGSGSGVASGLATAR